MTKKNAKQLLKLKKTELPSSVKNMLRKHFFIHAARKTQLENQQ